MTHVTHPDLLTHLTHDPLLALDGGGGDSQSYKTCKSLVNAFLKNIILRTLMRRVAFLTVFVIRPVQKLGASCTIAAVNQKKILFKM